MAEFEVFVDFAHPPATRRETYQFRSSWLASSLRAVKGHGFFDAYSANLSPRHRAAVLDSVPGQWLPIDVAVAHYGAIDALAIPPRTAYEMGREIQTHAQSVMAHLTLRASKSAGITPWTIFRSFRALWDRTWSGGDFAIYRVGPKEAQLEVVAWSIAPSPYVHQSMRGVLQGVTELFCERMYVRELASKSVGTSLAYRLAWA